MLRAALHLVIAATVLAVSPVALALGFGKSTTHTTLGQSLDFRTTLSRDAEEAIPPPRCLFADVYAGDAKVSADKVRVTLEAEPGSGHLRLRVTTSVAIVEPVASIELTVGCGSKISRRFTSFIDPAPVRLAEAVDAAPDQPPRSADRPASDVSPRRRLATPERLAAARAMARTTSRAPAAASAGRRTAARAARAATVRMAAATVDRNAQAPATPRRRAGGRAVVARSPADSGPRLRLDAPVAMARTASAPVPAAPVAVLPMAPSVGVIGAASATLAAEASASAAAADNPAAALQREQTRIQVLEAGLAKLRSDSQAMQNTLGALRARLQQAEGDRYGNGPIYALAGTTLFFALLAAAFWWLRPRQRRRARWFDEAASRRGRTQAGAGRSEPGAAPPSGPLREPAPVVVSAVAAMDASASETRPAAYSSSAYATLSARNSVLEPTSIGGLEVTTVLGPEASRHQALGAPSAGSGDGAQAPTIEALIDLEQQAEFYVVLGQDEAAIVLLEHHVRGSTHASPLPYLKLLELHQRRGDRRAYAQVREDFNECFNALAPDWSADLQNGRPLQAYATTMARLQALWPTPMQAMHALDAMLFRRDASAETFDFPAYRELLFLYGVAGELSGPVETGSGAIDLYLPLDDEAASEPLIDGSASAEASRFMVDLDVSHRPDAASANDLVIVRSAGRRGAAG